VRLELRHGSARPVVYDVPGEEFVVGSVPGCDLRLSGPNLPPVVCVLSRHLDGVRLRKLAPTLPLLLNGRPVQSAALQPGDLLTLGPLSVIVHIDGAHPATGGAHAVGFVTIPPSPPHDLDERQRRLDEQTAELEADRVLWYRRREDLERECAGREQALADLHQQQAEAERTSRELDARARQLAEQQNELDKLRDELAEVRRDLYQRYQERRDRLAGLQQAVQNAARKLQERKRQIEADAPRVRDLEARQASVDRREQELAEVRLAAAEEDRRREAEHQTARQQLDEREAECARREEQIAEQEARYQADLARLDRLQGTLEQRERQAEARTAEVDARYEQLRRDTLELEEQARQLDVAQTRQREDSERLTQQKVELESAASKLAERAALVEGQQAMLAALRTRLERMRDEVRQEAQLLTEQRARQEAAERDLQEKVRATEELRTTIDAESQSHAQARQTFEQRSAEIHAAITRLRELQDKLTADEAALKERGEQLDARAAEQAAQAEELTARAAQVAELQQRLDADRQALREREAALGQTDETRKALQEQLRRRAEELAARQKQLDEQTRATEEKAAEFARHHESIGQLRQQTEETLAAARQELERHGTELAERETALRRKVDRLKETGQTLAAERKAYFEAKAKLETDRRAAAEEADRLRAELDTARRQTAQEAAVLRRLLPDLELRGQAVLERLAQAREQLRGHLAELHTYARQSQEDLEGLRATVQAEAERLRQQELAVQRDRADHRLAVAAFRQQLIDWQARVAEMRQVLTQDGTRLERKEAEVAAAARQVDETSHQLARQAAELHAQEQQVVERRGEMERHLSDMREWYRRKLRELAESRAGEKPPADAAIVPLPPIAAGADHPPVPVDPVTPSSEPAVLSLTDELDPGDRQLGDLLRSLELVDADTLTALLLEARRQRRSLRQVLLSARGGAPLLTLYQLALIEAGNLDALMLGPLRVIDRLQATPRETVYRVFDPRTATTALLRHLAEAEMQDAVHPDEFRQRFAALAELRHPHVAATLEVLEVNGRPAALQEWLSGLPSTDWPALAAVPGVWYRLVSQAALGLATAHQAGLTHGRLAARSVVLTPDGVVKLTGVGEPPWLAGGPADPTPAADLAALGEVSAGWAALAPRRKGTKPSRPLPESLQQVLVRLRPDTVDRFPSAAALLEDLERAGADLPDGAEVWTKLVAHAAENATDGVAWRKSA
jgi:chromosome segregation ATPase